MSDPRNVARDKKVIAEKIHHGEDLTTGAAHVPQPGKKTAAADKHDPAHVREAAAKEAKAAADTAEEHKA